MECWNDGDISPSLLTQLLSQLSFSFKLFFFDGILKWWNAGKKAVGVGDSRLKTGRMDGLYLVK
jgi:hypothetical protein